MKQKRKTRRSKEKKEHCVRGWYYWINKEDKKEVELYVLATMVVTAATFHLDRSPLNAEAFQNAAGSKYSCWCKTKKKT